MGNGKLPLQKRQWKTGLVDGIPVTDPETIKSVLDPVTLDLLEVPHHKFNR